MSWAGIEVEIEGVRKASANVKTAKDVASYVYARACAYAGARHEDVVVNLIATAITEGRRLEREKLNEGMVEMWAVQDGVTGGLLIYADQISACNQASFRDGDAILRILVPKGDEG